MARIMSNKGTALDDGCCRDKEVEIGDDQARTAQIGLEDSEPRCDTLVERDLLYPVEQLK